jgi:hypothetical protein
MLLPTLHAPRYEYLAGSLRDQKICADRKVAEKIEVQAAALLVFSLAVIEYCLPSADWSHIDTRYRGYTVPSGSPESRKNIQKCDWVGFFRSPPRLLLLCIFTTRRFELNINYFVVLKTSNRNEKS